MGPSTHLDLAIDIALLYCLRTDRNGIIAFFLQLIFTSIHKLLDYELTAPVINVMWPALCTLDRQPSSPLFLFFSLFFFSFPFFLLDEWALSKPHSKRCVIGRRSTRLSAFVKDWYATPSLGRSTQFQFAMRWFSELRIQACVFTYNEVRFERHMLQQQCSAVTSFNPWTSQTLTLYLWWNEEAIIDDTP